MTENQSTDAICPNGHTRPEWIRLPRKGHRCPYSGLSRSSLNELILPNKENGGKPAVKSVCLRKRGQLRGTRLINYDSLMEHIGKQGLTADQAASPNQPE